MQDTFQKRQCKKQYRNLKNKKYVLKDTKVKFNWLF